MNDDGMKLSLLFNKLEHIHMHDYFILLVAAFENVLDLLPPHHIGFIQKKVF